MLTLAYLFSRKVVTSAWRFSAIPPKPGNSRASEVRLDILIPLYPALPSVCRFCYQVLSPSLYHHLVFTVLSASAAFCSRLHQPPPPLSELQGGHLSSCCCCCKFFPWSRGTQRHLSGLNFYTHLTTIIYWDAMGI